MNACKLVSSNYKGLYLACIIQTYRCPLLHRPFLAMVRSIDGRRFSAVFSTTNGLLAINELSGRSALTLAMIAGPS